MTTPPDITILEAVGQLLGRELRTRDARLKALEERPVPEPVKGDKGERGEPGERGAPGLQGEPAAPGRDGAGIDAPGWAAGVYREGAVVQHHIGQFFRALKDTAAEPPGADWQRVGCAGFRLTGGFTEGRAYEEGDLFVRDYGLFQWHAGEAHLWAGRGAKGEPGQRGAPGDPGKDGKDGLDGAVVQAIEVRGATMVLVQRRPDASLSHLEVDMMPFVEGITFALQDKFALQLGQLKDELEERIAKATAGPTTPRNGRGGHHPSGNGS